MSQNCEATQESKSLAEIHAGIQGKIKAAEHSLEYEKYNARLEAASDLFGEKRYDDAIVLLKEMLELRPSFHINALLGIVYNRKGRKWDVEGSEYDTIALRKSVNYFLDAFEEFARYNNDEEQNDVENLSSCIEVFAETFYLDDRLII